MATLTNHGLSWGRRKPAPAASDALLDALPVAAALFDGSGVVRAVNRRWTECDPSVAPGESYLHFCDRLYPDNPGCAGEVGAGIRSVLLRRSRSFRRDCSLGREANARTLRLTVAPYGSDSSPEALVVAEWTRQNALDEQSRVQAQKMETVGRMVGGVAHDFANLITLIAGYSDILIKRMAADDPLRQQVEEIHRAATRGSRLTSQLLGFSRRQSFDPRPLDLNALIVDLESMLRPIVGEYIQLETRLAPGLGRVVADPGQMEQVVMNLVLNARDAMPSGGRIVVETRAHEVTASEASDHGAPSGPVIELSISDTGHGMTPETLDRLFEPFFTTKEKGKGTGLGLNTVYNIVKQNRGDVWAESRPGHGARFTIWLPSTKQAETAAAPPAPRHAAPVGSGETILLAEDEEGVRRLLAHILSKRGYRVLEASGGEEALALFEQQPDAIDLLLTDMVMPHMSGRELASRLLRVRPDLNVVYMSGYTDDVLVRTGALGPGMSFLQKPLRSDVLAARVREALDCRARAGSEGA